LALVCLPAQQGLAFKPTAEFGHVGIVREAITPITRTSSSGETLRFSARAIEEIRDATAGVDDLLGEFQVPNAHCDDELLPACSQRIITLKNDIIANLASEGRVGSFARAQVGRALHTLQDFYAHSNWVNSPGPGNAGANSALGRSVLPAVPPGTPTCVDDTSDGALTGAGLTSITSGYFPLVTPAGKCAHGLVQPGTGIHKDEPVRPFHTAARAAAVLSTQDLINQILNAPGVAGNDEAIKAFMDIRGTRGFVIDDTCSMGPDIAGVRSSVQQIINRLAGTKFAPDSYLMVRFGDPDVGAPFTTPDPAALLSEVDTLSPLGGGDCPEMSQAALLSAISGATGGGHLYLYSDASAKDANLAGNVSAAANVKKVNINYVITGSCSPLDPAYIRVAQETGGQVFFIRRSEVGAMFHLIEPSLSGDLRPMLVLNDQFTGGSAKNFDVPVDSTVTRVTFSASADGLPSVRLFRPSGDEVLTTDPDVVYTQLSAGRIYTVDSPAAGLWSMSLNGTGNLSLSVLGNSPIDFADFAFVELRGRLQHEGLFRLDGQPILGEDKLARARIFGPYASVAFERVALDGTVLGPFALDPGGHVDAASDEYVGHLVLPAEPFRVYARGVDASGAAFRRAFAPTFRGQTVKVEAVTVGASLPPAVTTTIEFRVTNLGVAGSFRITASDEAGFVTEVVPSVISLESAESAVVNVRLFVPNGTTRQSDTLTVFARSTSNPDTGNSALIGLPVGVPPPGSADISVTKTHSPASPLVGHDLTYTVRVSNNGPDAATGVTVGDALPAEVTFVSAIASQGGCVGTSVVSCDLGSLSSGSQATVTIVVRPTVTGMISNTVSVASDQSDPAPGNNEATDIVSMTGSNGPFGFYTLTPCRVLDTRRPDGPLGGPALAARADRTFVLAGSCGIPATAKAVSVNLTVTGSTTPGDLRLYPAGSSLPLVSSINFGPGRTRANNATLPLGAGGAITVRCVLVGGTVHFILDVNGYYE
jgi:uncharacterized repeat protein (TIGR01451 family)